MREKVGDGKLVFGLLLALLVVANISQLFTPVLVAWLVSIIFICLLLFIAKRLGLTFNDLGLSRAAIPRGLLWGGVSFLVILLGLVVAFWIDPGAFRDSRYHEGFLSALYAALVFIPFHTVIVEELAFRGVLWGALAKRRGGRFATLVSSVLFGLWHIVPSLGLNQSSGSVGGAVGSGGAGQVISILVAVLVTTGAGVAFCELRRRSGSLIAPVLAHWSINATAVLLAVAAWGR